MLTIFFGTRSNRVRGDLEDGELGPKKREDHQSRSKAHPRENPRYYGIIALHYSARTKSILVERDGYQLPYNCRSSSSKCQREQDLYLYLNPLPLACSIAGLCLLFMVIIAIAWRGISFLQCSHGFLGSRLGCW